MAHQVLTPTSSQPDRTVSADGLQGGLLEVLARGEPVNEIECHRRSLKPLSTIIKRPNAVGFRKLIHECLNKRIRHSAGITSICGLDKVRTGAFSGSALLVTRRLVSSRASTLVRMSEMFMAASSWWQQNAELSGSVPSPEDYSA